MYKNERWYDEQRETEPAPDVDDEEICAQCNGSGEGMYDGSICSSCKGSGAASNLTQEDIEDAKADAYNDAKEDDDYTDYCMRQGEMGNPDRQR